MMENKTMAKLNMDERQHLVDLLANATSGMLAFTAIDYDEEDAKKAVNELKTKLHFTDDMICREDVWLQILADGNSLILTETDEGGGNDHKLTLLKLLKGIDMYFKSDYGCKAKNFEELEENGDFYDNEAILQLAIFGDVIYG